MGQATKKAVKKNSPHRAQAVPGWAWLLAGLAIGLSIALLTSMKDRANLPPPVITNTPQSPAQPKDSNAKSEEKKTAKPRLDFYDLLPKMEVIIPDRRNKAGQTAPIDKPGTYILQVGSFRSFGEADSLKAQLALWGVESKIESVTVNNTDTWHRVLVRPTQDLRELNKIRTRLLNHNFTPILLRING